MLSTVCNYRDGWQAFLLPPQVIARISATFFDAVLPL
jgi:hypothetical protein